MFTIINLAPPLLAGLCFACDPNSLRYVENRGNYIIRVNPLSLSSLLGNSRVDNNGSVRKINFQTATKGTRLEVPKATIFFSLSFYQCARVSTPKNSD